MSSSKPDATCRAKCLCNSSRRRPRSEVLEDDGDPVHFHRRKSSKLSVVNMSSSIPDAPLQKSLSMSQQPLSSLNVADKITDNTDINKKQLEWELSTLEADDLRSHAWYHGSQVDRVEAERLLRQCVAEEHGLAGVEEGEHINDPDSDGLEDVSSASSDGDFAFDDFLDDLIDDRNMVPDPNTATSSLMAAEFLQQQRRCKNGMLLSKRPIRPQRGRRHFYCFLVRDSMNVKPPGRFVVSCLRVDKYDGDDAVDKDKKHGACGTSDKQKRKQHQRRQRRQQRHPVLHFVINEIILQPGTVYERSQFTFGDSLPTVAPMTTATSSTIVNNQSGTYAGRKYQPGFDSVPDLIRYYVGGADDNAVLSYGGSEGIMGSNMFPQTLYTEVRIRYPCNRRRPLIMMSNETTNPTFIPDIIDQTQMIRQHSQALAAASVLAEVLKVPATTPVVLPEKSSSLSHIHHKSRPPSPPPPYKIRPSSSFRLSPRRRIPSATVTSMTCSESFSNQRLSDQGLTSSTTLPRQSSSSFSQLEITQRPSTSRSPSTLPVASSSGSSKSLPRPLTTQLRPSTSKLSSSNLDQTNVELAHSALSLLGTFNLTPSTTISVINKPKMPIEPSLKTMETLKLSNTPSTSSMFGTNTDGGSRRGVIDIDAEIAAALSQGGDFDNDIDLSKMFTLSKFVDVQSSFSPVNVGNVQHYTSGSGRSKLNRSEIYWNKFNNSNRTSRNFDYDQSTSNTSYNNNNRKNLKKHQFSLSPSNNTSRRSPMLGVEAPKRQGHTMLEEHKKQAEKNYYQQFEHGELQYAPQETYQRSTKCSKTEGIECITNKSDSPANQNTCEEGINDKTKYKSMEEEQDLEHWADTEVKRLEREGKMDPEEDSDDEELGPPLDPLENEDFEEWRSRRTNVLRHRFGSPDQRRQERSRRRRTRLMGLRVEKLRQQRTWCEQQKIQIDNKILEKRSKTESEYCTVSYRTAYNLNHKIMLGVHNNRGTEVTTENMVSQWLLQTEPLIKNDQKDTVVCKQSQNHQVREPNHVQQLRSQRCKPTVMPRDHRSPAGDDPPPPGSSPSPAVDDPLPIGQDSSSSGDNPPPAGDDTPSAGDDQSAGDNPSPVDSDTSVAGNHSSPLRNYFEGEKSFPEQFSKSIIMTRVPNQYDHKNDIIDIDCIKQYNCQYDHTQSSSIDNKTSLKNDYENIMAFDDRENDYENICLSIKKKNVQMKVQRPLYSDNEGCTVVMAALRAIHLAIIGDPEDSPGAITVAGTGKLAAALCGADGRVTILPYRRHYIDCERKGIPVEPYLSTCPLQLLGQLGPAGRRARLDVIERFSCLQYLVAMTVIVTPSLMLIGNSNIDLRDHHSEWSLEKEYEYRRRQFYYGCAGVGGLYACDEDSGSDNANYSQMAYPDLESNYSQPLREEWVEERRHWLDRLAQYRAAALDKWIRTATDVKQAAGDVYGYRALMSALCSDRIQALQDAWASLRRLHTATAVAFESRLRPEFLGRRDKNIMNIVGEASHNDNLDYDNGLDSLLQLPPNATIPDATALAVLYEQMYNDDDNKLDIDINRKEEKNIWSSSLITSPILLLPSLWASTNDTGSALGRSVSTDFDLQDIHDFCVQYSKWIQQAIYNSDSKISSPKQPKLQLDRFRSNIRTLLHQFQVGEDHLVNSDEEDMCCNRDDLNSVFYDEENNCNFAYERHYEDQVEELSGGDHVDSCVDEDDDDATVICCSSSNITAAVKDTAKIKSPGRNFAAAATTSKKKRQNTAVSRYQPLEDDRYYNWIKAAGMHEQCPPPLDIVFHTELHVRLFWPPTLFLFDGDNIDNKVAVPAYALGTTNAATAEIAHNNKNHSSHNKPSTLTLDHVITQQLDRASQDMHVRYKAMDAFLDAACAYSMSAAKSGNLNNELTAEQQ